jgi:sugar lactone lactonase YvrE
MGAWTNTANATWLHLSSTNQIGTGSTNVVFSYDANPSPTRFGTLTIGDQTLTVTQAGSTYVAARPLTTLVSSNQNTPLNEPFGVAVDGAGNVYVANISNIPEWKPASDTVSYLVPSGLHVPCGVAVDSVGNLYIADTFASALKMWTAANSNLTTLVPAYNPNAPFNENLNAPYGVAVDGAGNVYIADTFDRAIKKWTAANSNVTTLVAGLVNPYGVALDSAGNVYIAEASGEGFGSVVQEWTAANGIVTTLVAYPEVYAPYGVAVDGAGNVYIADFGHNAIEELPYAFVDPTPRLESLSAGNDALPPVLPATENLLPPFAPTSDQSWLTITGITNGVVSFSFTADTGPARTANITVLGQTIPITQGLIGTPPILIGAQMLGNGVLQFAFTNNPSGAFTVLSTTNLSLPLSNWTVVGTATNFASGQFQFTSAPTTNDAQCFYTVRSP